MNTQYRVVYKLNRSKNQLRYYPQYKVWYWPFWLYTYAGDSLFATCYNCLDDAYEHLAAITNREKQLLEAKRSNQVIFNFPPKK